MSSLIVRKEDGSLLFDTDKITYGLVKSGYLAYSSSWTRRTLRSAQLDPSDGSNWVPSAQVDDILRYDQMWSFTVSNARSPIVFIVGSGVLNGSSTSGSDITFHYSNASANTKFYCFDLMYDGFTGRPFLKTFNTSGVLTFNSLQPPLNIIGSYTPPPPLGGGAWDSQIAYTGGYSSSRQASNNDVYSVKMDCIFDVTLTAGVEYAVFLPWSRGGAYNDTQVGLPGMYGVGEGAFGRVGGISFMFGAFGGTILTLGTAPRPAGWYNIPSDRYPQALVITTANLPFPFN